jgi:excisionase family DNA binding protein
MTETFFTTNQVAEKLQMNVDTVRRLIRIGGLPGVYIGNTYRIPESELQRWMDAHKIRRQ